MSVRPPAPGEIELPAGGTMARRPLGRTGVRVSMLGLGGNHIARHRDEQQAIRIVRMAVDHGMDFLDNCWDYHQGLSEEWMGKALLDGYRARAFLMTKIDGRTGSAATLQLEQSLRRLQTDVIDLVQLHEVIRMDDVARAFAPGGAMAALQQAQKAGKLRFIGFTGHKDPAIHLAMLQAGVERGFRFDAVQMPLNVMDAHYRSFERAVLPVLLEHDIGVLGMKSMGDGVLLTSGVVSPRECLQYALGLPTSVVITGCDTVGVLEQALAVGMGFVRQGDDERRALLARTAAAAADGRFELFKTSQKFDGTTQHPHWLESAVL
jgi:aryl-alcohol dehydrogenase-like predicted oxidoreductase